MDLDVEVSEIVFMGNSTDTRYTRNHEGQQGYVLDCVWETCGSAIKRSVSLTIRFGRAAMMAVKVCLYRVWCTECQRASLSISAAVGPGSMTEGPSTNGEE